MFLCFGCWSAGLGLQQLLVQGDDQRAERKWTHKVSSDDVEAAGVRAWFLLLQPVPQTLPVPEGQRLQGLLGVLGDVGPVSRQVEAGHEEAVCAERPKSLVCSGSIFTAADFLTCCQLPHNAAS